MTDNARPATPPATSTTTIRAVDRPRGVTAVIVLLLTNLALSIGVTAVALATHHTLVAYQLDHAHLSDAAARDAATAAANHAIWLRVGTNVAVSVAYAFLVRALLRGRRWAYRRVITIGIAGIAALLFVITEPYPAWFHLEQLTQAAILAALLFTVTRPAVRAHYAPGLPGRDIRRFRNA